MDCNERGVCTKRTASSAKNNKNNLSSSNVTIPSISVLTCWMISFRENKQSKLFDGSPCFTPNFELMKSELMPLYRIHALVEQYIDLSAMVTYYFLPKKTSINPVKHLFTVKKCDIMGFSIFKRFIY